MGNSLRCCLACVLPCGALDVIRIVHLSGHIEEYGRPVFAGEIVAANPGHVLSKPSCMSSSSRGGVAAARLLVVSPESELKRGGFYFLIPSSSVPNKNKKSCRSTHKTKTKTKTKTKRKVVVEASESDSLEQEILTEKKSGLLRKRSGRVRVWKPRLESILEDS